MKITLTPDVLARSVLRDRFIVSTIEPADEWEQRLLGLARNCGVSLLNEAPPACLFIDVSTPEGKATGAAR